MSDDVECFAAQASQKYSIKDYAAASDLYAQATEAQAEINGELAAENAELLYLYGRSLYHLGVSESDVLGGKVAGDPDTGESEKKKPVQKDGKPTTASSKGDETTGGVTSAANNKPYFQFTGDENLVGSDDEKDDDEDNNNADNDSAEEEEEDDDPFSAAWQSLDLARLLFDKQLLGIRNRVGAFGSPEFEGSAEVRQIRERLADVHDLLAEILLEREDFNFAAYEFKTSLQLKEKLYPPESGVMAEAHYKLSLALEFDSPAAAADYAREGSMQRKHSIQTRRDEAVQHMEAAIRSTKLRLEKEEAILNSDPSDEQSLKQKKEISKESIQELREMIADMEQRVTDLRVPPVSIDPVTGVPTEVDSSNPIAGIIASAFGATPDERRAKLQEAINGANDLTGLIKRRKRPTPDPREPRADLEDVLNDQGNGHKKRRAEDEDEEGVEVAKKAKLEGTPAEGKDGGAESSSV